MQKVIVGMHARKTCRDYAEVIDNAHNLVRSSAPSAIPCAAVFISGPRNTRINISRECAIAIGSRSVRGVARGESSRVVFHASYLDLPWSEKGAEGTLARFDDLATICAIARADLVIHSGARIFDAALTRVVMARLSQSIATARAAATHYEPRFYIETMSSDARFADPRAINAIFDDAGPHGAIGLCVDTAHVWAAGADISTRASCAAWLRAIRDDIPVALHLNDSAQPIGTRRDVHAELGRGEIWALEDGYASAVEWARERDAPIILERNIDPIASAARDLQKIERLIR